MPGRYQSSQMMLSMLRLQNTVSNWIVKLGLLWPTSQSRGNYTRKRLKLTKLTLIFTTNLTFCVMKHRSSR